MGEWKVKQAYILTLPSSPHVANMHGSAGFQDTALQRGWCALNLWTGTPVALCQTLTWPSAFQLAVPALKLSEEPQDSCLLLS